MLTRTRLANLVDAALDEAKTGTTYGALLAVVGDSNREWLYGWLNGQRRCRPPCVVLRADGKYIRPQYVVRPVEKEPSPAVLEAIGRASAKRWANQHAKPATPSKAFLRRQAAERERQERQDRWFRMITLWRQGAKAPEIAQEFGITVYEARAQLKAARSWWNRAGRP